MDYVEIEWGDVGWIHLAKDKNQWQTCKNMIYDPFGSHKMLGIS
jgi:hypothetical protein